MKLSKDDKIRQHATQQLRTYWEINFKEFNEMFEINTKEYFKKEIETLNEMVQDGIVAVNDDAIRITELGKDLAPDWNSTEVQKHIQSTSDEINQLKKSCQVLREELENLKFEKIQFENVTYKYTTG